MFRISILFGHIVKEFIPIIVLIVKVFVLLGVINKEQERLSRRQIPDIGDHIFIKNESFLDSEWMLILVEGNHRRKDHQQIFVDRNDSVYFVHIVWRQETIADFPRVEMEESYQLISLKRFLCEETVRILLQKEDLALLLGTELGDLHLTVLPHLHLEEKRVRVTQIFEFDMDASVKDSVP